MKKLLLIATLLFFVAAEGFSQSGNQDMTLKKGYIHLKNGSILVGKYRYSPDLDKIVILSQEATVVLPASDVDKITNTNPLKKTRIEEKVHYKPSPFFNITEIGFLAGNQDNVNKSPLIAHSTLYYSFSGAFAAGLGAGLELFKESYLPITANAMYMFGKNRRVKPYISLQAGYEIPIEKTRMSYQDVIPKTPIYYDYSVSSYFPYPYYQNKELKTRGGMLVNPSVGFVYQLTNGFGMGLSLGYRYHLLNYQGDESYRLEVAYNRLSVKLGFIFN